MTKVSSSSDVDVDKTPGTTGSGQPKDTSGKTPGTTNNKQPKDNPVKSRGTTGGKQPNARKKATGSSSKQKAGKKITSKAK